MTSPLRSGRLVLLASLVATPRLVAQVPATYTLSISDHGTETGREVVSIRPGPGGLPSTTLSGIARYPAVRPRAQVTGTLDRGADGALVSAQFDWQTPEHAWRTYVQAGVRRLTVRTATEGRESAREYPVDARTVVLDDSLFTPWIMVAALAAGSEAPIHAVWPRAGRRGDLQVRRSTGADGGTTIRVSGDAAAEIDLAGDGRLLRVILPDRGITATVTGP